jgi:hypothetical protein
MLTPGIALSSGRYDITASASPTATAWFQGGFGRGANDVLLVDTDAPSGALWLEGYRVNATGCIFGTTSEASDDVWISGLRCSIDGAIVYEAAAATQWVNGNPITANGRLAVA